MISFALGLIIAKIITKETKLDGTIIQNNSINFLLTGDDEHKKAIIHLFTSMLQQHVNYPLFVVGGKNYKVYGKNNQFSVKYILVAFDDNKISIFPFINDGLYVEPNPIPLSLLAIIGKQLLHLDKTTDTATTLIESFKDFTQTNKILRMIKNISHRNVIITFTILALIIFIIAVLTHPEYIPPINKVDLFTGFILFILGVFSTAAINWVWKKIKKS